MSLAEDSTSVAIRSDGGRPCLFSWRVAELRWIGEQFSLVLRYPSCIGVPDHIEVGQSFLKSCSSAIVIVSEFDH